MTDEQPDSHAPDVQAPEVHGSEAQAPEGQAAEMRATEPAADDSAANTARFAAQLKQDVRSWSARENDATDRAADATLAMAAKQAKATTVRKRSKPAAKPAVVAEPQKGRPFSMSYEGVSNAQYLAGRIARGAR
jgi:hypothetical protein